MLIEPSTLRVLFISLQNLYARKDVFDKPVKLRVTLRKAFENEIKSSEVWLRESAETKSKEKKIDVREDIVARHKELVYNTAPRLQDSNKYILITKPENLSAKGIGKLHEKVKQRTVELSRGHKHLFILADRLTNYSKLIKYLTHVANLIIANNTNFTFTNKEIKLISKG